MARKKRGRQGAGRFPSTTFDDRKAASKRRRLAIGAAGIVATIEAVGLACIFLRVAIVATMAFREKVWKELVDLARRKRTKPETLAERAVIDFLQRVTDEDLILRSESAARKRGLASSRAEELIRKFRLKSKA